MWKKINRFNGRLSVNELGQIKNNKTGRILKPQLDMKGYLRIRITHNRVKHSIRVHREVAMAFISNPQNKKTVNHKNGVKTDNTVGNLEWMTNAENMRHAYDNGIRSNGVGEQVGTSKLTAEQIVEIRNKFAPRKYTRAMLGKEYGVAAATIKDIVLRKSWIHI